MENFKIGISGIRGIIGEGFNATIILRFSAAFGRQVGSGKVIFLLIFLPAISVKFLPG